MKWNIFTNSSCSPVTLYLCSLVGVKFNSRIGSDISSLTGVTICLTVYFSSFYFSFNSLKRNVYQKQAPRSHGWVEANKWDKPALQLKINKKVLLKSLKYLRVLACFPHCQPCVRCLYVFREHWYLNSGKSTKAHHSAKGQSTKSWNLSQNRVCVSVCGRDNTHCQVGPRSVHHSMSRRLM